MFAQAVKQNMRGWFGGTWACQMGIIGKELVVFE